ncbi:MULTISPECIES: DUF1289 domain-containing protein [unclassified Shewanella]|uniref:DUF1289 domain-containing protein n=1 Tax=unclassified Shewanella TaxID=196818 RepID=UPI000C81E30A|nr:MULTISPECIES: DUF1289 domain-containing protein [unclassified Shewanella]MDO6620560.1 DUF1289 domain-containing protein [Shewanella sp. 6_MG-2023]MDO6641493.1 DUF1289 domain-containing protein [Shewanella sp. 5_MG-2023]MDO6680553.1 DUF1289 domain-containing protein [Shewanella sp. 4_MG-2023]PMG28264.1 hypothetical protein BCU94_18060 [Shewanella sp. 10N.286.52.C2]PMG40632.1 hypothetical protein BCU91_12345 [Shewanella sp. 10N.286.52.B9]
MHSPCVAKCGLNEADYCMGCFRHINEIVGWGQASEEKKQAVWQQLPQRKERMKGGNNSQIISREKWLKAQAEIEQP